MSPELINNIATLAGVLVAGIGAFVFAFWVAMGIWTFNDIRSRTRDWLAILLAVLLVIVFPIVGLILYTLIRPKATLAETYDRALEEEALLRELEETQACQSCGVPVKDNWIFCPNCHGQLQHTCPSCSNLVRNEWAICVYCGTAQRAAQPRELSARETQSAYQPAYQSASAARPTLEGQAAPQLGLPSAPSAQPGSSMSAGMNPMQPVAVQRRPARNPFAAPARSDSPSGMTTQSGITSQPGMTSQSGMAMQSGMAGSVGAPPSSMSPAPATPPMAPPLSPPLSALDYPEYPEYDDNPYRPTRPGEG